MQVLPQLVKRSAARHDCPLSVAMHALKDTRHADMKFAWVQHGRQAHTLHPLTSWPLAGPLVQLSAEAWALLALAAAGAAAPLMADTAPWLDFTCGPINNR